MPRTLSTLLIPLLLFTITACNGENGVQTEETGEQQQTFRSDTSAAEAEEGRLTDDQLYDLIDAGVHPSRLEGRDHIIDHLPEPRDITVEPRENRHIPDQIDSVKTYHYDGLEVQTYDISDDPQTIITSITITSSDYRSPDGIAVGMTREEVEDAMMTPDQEEDDRWIYHFETEATNTFTVIFQDDRVERLEWGFYYD